MQYPAITVKKKGASDEVPAWNMSTLLPSEDEHGTAIGTIYYHKCVCEICGNGIHSEFQRLYTKVRASEVFDYLAIKKAVDYGK